MPVRRRRQPSIPVDGAIPFAERPETESLTAQKAGQKADYTKLESMVAALVYLQYYKPVVYIYKPIVYEGHNEERDEGPAGDT